MWKLTIEDDEGQRTTLELGDEDYTIGRADDASIRLTERNVSRKHAVIKHKPEGGGWLIEDGGSYNGIFVNGERIEQAVAFNPGDSVQLADYRLEIVDQQETAPAVEEDPRKVRPDRLVMVIGPSPGQEYPLNVDRVGIGRAEDATISINHASVSRLHCELVQMGQGRWEVVDSGSANGIRINGVELRRGIIEPGDALELGDVRLRYVAAGKYYRPGAADLSQQLPAVPFDAMTPATTSGVAPQARKSGGSTVVMVGAIVAVLIVVGAYVMLRPASGAGGRPAASGTAMAQSEEEARLMLKTAQESAAEDIEYAHKTLMRIPADSPVRDSTEFKTIEDKWADYMFAKAEKTNDPAEKARILNKISETESVSAEKREKAASMTPERPTTPIDLDQNGRPPGTAAGSTPHPAGSAATPTHSSGTTDTPTPSSEASAPPPENTGTPDKFEQNPQKAGLMAKMQSGRASEADLRMLKAICMTDGDKSCRNAAVAALKKLQH